MTSPRYSEVVLKPGDPAPEFALRGWPKPLLASADILAAGRSFILAFYIDDETPGSIRELRAFSSDVERFAQRQCVIACVSFNDIESHRQVALNHGLSERLHLLSDTTHDTARRYGAVTGDRNLPEQILFLVGADGLIKHVHRGMPDNAALLNLLAQ